jgi:hypothetical protein
MAQYLPPIKNGGPFFNTNESACGNKLVKIPTYNRIGNQTATPRGYPGVIPEAILGSE